MNRAHLIGFTFSGLNNEGKNLVPMTAWLNSGSFQGLDDNNPDSMIYYEHRLERWLEENPDYWLDYKVTPIYTDNELLPRKIELQYVGLDAEGNVVSIQLGGKETIDESLRRDALHRAKNHLRYKRHKALQIEEHRLNQSS